MYFVWIFIATAFTFSAKAHGSFEASLLVFEFTNVSHMHCIMREPGVRDIGCDEHEKHRHTAVTAAMQVLSRQTNITAPRTSLQYTMHHYAMLLLRQITFYSSKQPSPRRISTPWTGLEAHLGVHSQILLVCRTWSTIFCILIVLEHQQRLATRMADISCSGASSPYGQSLHPPNPTAGVRLVIRHS